MSLDFHNSVAIATGDSGSQNVEKEMSPKETAEKT
jgi:hypothetical protein